MKTELIQSKIDPLWGSKVTRLEFDIINHRISIDLHQIPSEGFEINYSIEFQGVSAYYYALDEDDRRHNIPQREFLKLTDIYINHDDIIEHSNKKGFHYNANPNFWLGFWTSILLIEAKSIKIDDKIFTL